MPRHTSAVPIRVSKPRTKAAEPVVEAAAAEPEPVAKAVRTRKPRANPEAVDAPAEVVAAAPAKARKPPSEAQLANRKRFAEKNARIKELRAADPKLTQSEARALAK